MDDYYTEMKTGMGIDQKFGEEEEYPLLEQAIKQLRPNMNPKAFIKMMKKKDNIHKDTRNKAIIRKTNERMNSEAFNRT